MIENKLNNILKDLRLNYDESGANKPVLIYGERAEFLAKHLILNNSPNIYYTLSTKCLNMLSKEFYVIDSNYFQFKY